TNIIGYGNEYPFNEAVTYDISCAALDNTHFVVGFSDGGDNEYGKCMIGTISDTNIIGYGNEYPFNEAVTYYVSCAALDATHFVVGYEDVGGDNYGIAMIGTRSEYIPVGLENKSANMGSKMVAAGLI
ncbi:unnamed protein product, partial [marine sediment metagenome]